MGDYQDLSRVVVLEDLNGVHYWYARFYHLLGRRILYLRDANRSDGRFEPEKLNKWAEAIDYSKCKAIDPALVNDDSRGYAEKLFNKIEYRDELLGLYHDALKNIKDKSKKMQVLLYGSICREITEVRLMEAFAEALERDGHIKQIIFVMHNGFWRKWLLEILGRSVILTGSPIWLRIPNLFIVTSFSRLKRVLKGVLKSLLKIIYKENLNVSSIASAVQQVGKFEVLFFPHQSVSYGGLYRKDHFYSEDSSSPFYNKNILHIELDGAGQAGEFPDLYWNKNDDNPPVIVLPGAVLDFLENFGKDKRYPSLRSLFKLSIMRPLWYLVVCSDLLELVFQFDAYRRRCKCFTNAKIALIGYDILFPPVLSLALESVGIKTVAVQERFFSTFFKSHPMILNTYLVPSDECVKIFKQSIGMSVKHFFSVGLLRTDLIKKKSLKVEPGVKQFSRPRVLIVDFHSNPEVLNGISINRLLALNNWLSNRSFYRDVLRLCREFPEIDFTIRGKDLNWMQISYFDKIKKKLELVPNLTISKDYSKIHIQYLLVSESCLVIGRHTSLLDEAWASGKSVIFMDNYPHCNSYIDKIWNYENLPVQATNYCELVEKLKNLLELTSIKQSTNQSEFASRWYGPYDGNVGLRIKSLTEKIYAE